MGHKWTRGATGGQEVGRGAYDGPEVGCGSFLWAKNGPAELPVGRKWDDGCIPCDSGTFHQLPLTLCAAKRHSVNSVNFPCHRENSRQVPYPFLWAEIPFVNFCPLSWWLGGLPLTSIKSSWRWETVHHLPSIFCVAETFRQLSEPPSFLRNYIPLFFHSRDVPSTSIKFLCNW